MPFVHGRSVYLKLGTSDLSAYADNTDFPVSADVHETTTYGKSWKTKVGGLKAGSFSVGGLYDATAVTGVETVLRPMVGTTVVFEVGPEGNAAGKVKYSGSCVVENYNLSAPVGDMIRWTASLQTTDTVTAGVFP